MTTIAHNGKTIAWDSRRTSGGRIISDNIQKCIKHGGRTFWCAGVAGDFKEFTEQWADRASTRELDVEAFVQDTDGALYHCGTDGLELWRSPAGHMGAIGSGGAHALTAMDCGLEPAQAVRMAAKRDVYTGGTIRSQSL